MPHIIVASKNPVKIQAALNGFEAMFPEKTFTVEGVSIPSGVSDQPMGNDETFQGAFNRAKAARDSKSNADYWVGIEGGNIAENDEMEVMAWIIVLSKNRMGKGRTAGFFLPSKTVELVNQGYELGEADDIVFGVSNSKHTSGASGLLTDDVIDRLGFYMPAVILALIPFKKPDLYPR